MSPGDPLSGRDLAAFVSAVELGSVQGAADALALTQSAASKRILALERRIGQPLLERHGDGVRLTAAGQLLYPAAREALAALERTEAVLVENTAHPTLRIQASRTIGETTLPQWISAFRASEPDTHIYVDVTNSSEVLEAVRAGRVEVGFIEGPTTVLHGLRDVVVAEDEILVVVASGHPWARRPSIPVAELSGERFFARERGSGTRAVIDLELAATGFELTPTLEVASTEGLKRAVLTGGFTLLSRRSVAAELASGELSAIAIRGASWRRYFRAVRRSRPALQGPAQRFWKQLERRAAERQVSRSAG